LPEGVEDGAGAVLDLGRGQHGHAAVGQAEGELGAAVGVFLGGDAGGYWGLSVEFLDKVHGHGETVTHFHRA
jgi:hypothetical protein